LQFVLCIFTTHYIQLHFTILTNTTINLGGGRCPGANIRSRHHPSAARFDRNTGEKRGRRRRRQLRRRVPARFITSSRNDRCVRVCCFTLIYSPHLSPARSPWRTCITANSGPVSLARPLAQLQFTYIRLAWLVGGEFNAPLDTI